uniref:Uncharacterized protein n=1 Tax=Gopherus agassizii TaxID=38772 RepID=A0A452GGX2_9SAUR
MNYPGIRFVLTHLHSKELFCSQLLSQVVSAAVAGGSLEPRGSGLWCAMPIRCLELLIVLF